jgi:hypothetical protein
MMEAGIMPHNSKEERVLSPMDKPITLTLDILQFIQQNVLNVSEITRTTKLTEILDSYTDKKSEEVYIIQNTRNKGARGVFLDLDYFAELIAIKQLVEESADLIVERTAHDRIHKTAGIGLDTAIARLELNDEDVADIMKMAEIET